MAQLINNRQPVKPEGYSKWIFLHMKSAVRALGSEESMEKTEVPKPDEILDTDFEFISFRQEKICHC